ncbi:NAD(P)-dependent oxidoreductase [Gemmata sp. G18]|uniref:NAD(P)-dependent oxidoreductase n=1 Tax=Gemmata palustris TaxID=2822762 RepID=A0ABS5BP55_9BACT|nr:NAD(P)-dependent oxidoreductase [Gemmata palustris]MBP3955510.1 NAD(P)-dependent oxidoreductase [Gemmata palustris]
MNTPKRILVTGSAGRLGRAAVAELVARGHHVIGFDVLPTPGLPPERSIVAGLLDLGTLYRAATGADAIIHLAATPDDAKYPRGAAPDDGDNFVSELVPNNVIGPYQVMEAARALKIPRVVLASTGQVIDGHLVARNVPVTPESPPRPRYLYACTKVFLEALGQVYAKEHGIEVLAVRLGWCPRPGQEEEFRQSELGPDVYLSPGDAGRFFAATVEVAKLPPFAVVYATSLHTQIRQYDLTSSRELLGWEPRDRWPTE